MDPQNGAWYYAREGEQHGPVPFIQIKNMVASGQLDPAELVWAEGMDDWRPYRERVERILAEYGTTLPVAPAPAR